jgi:ABC-2 type transport system ATP-binding protein
MRMPHSEPGPTGVEVELGSEEEAADVIVALVRAGVRVVAVAPSGGDLEAAYLELTQDRR